MRRLLFPLKFLFITAVTSCSYFNNDPEVLNSEWSEVRGLEGIQCESTSIAPYLRIDSINNDGEAVVLEGRGNEYHVFPFSEKTDLSRLEETASYIPFLKSESLVAVYPDSIITYLHQNEHSRFLLQRRGNEVIGRKKVDGNYELIQSHSGLSYLLEVQGKKIIIPTEGLNLIEIELQKEPHSFPQIRKVENRFEGVYTSNEHKPNLLWFSSENEEKSIALDKPAKDLRWIKGKDKSHLLLFQGSPFDGDNTLKYLSFSNSTFTVESEFLLGDADTGEPLVISNSPLHFLMLERLNEKSVLRSYKAAAKNTGIETSRMGVLENPDLRSVSLPLVSNSFLVEYQEAFTTKYLKCAF